LGRYVLNRGQVAQSVRRGINSINATQNFSTINYSLEDGGGKEQFKIRLNRNQTKSYLNSVYFDSLFKSGILINLTRRKKTFKMMSLLRRYF
jgi:NTE family protein